MQRHLVWLAVLGALLLPVSAHAAPDEPFGVEPVARPMQTAILREWKTMPQKMLRDAAVLEFCREDLFRCSPAVASLVGLIDRVKGFNFYTKLVEVDTAINQMVAHVSDLEQWGPTEESGASEVWSSPLDIAGTGKGDCDDFVNLKFFVLWQAGVPLDKMRLVVLDYDVGQLHIVLAVRTAKEWLLLDNSPLKKAITPGVRYALHAYDLYAPSAVATALPSAR